MDTMFSLKDPRLHFRRKKLQKICLHGFFWKNFLKKAIFGCFSYSIPYISEPRLNKESMVSCIAQTFHRQHFSLKMTSKIFPYSVFWAKKDEKTIEIFKNL